MCTNHTQAQSAHTTHYLARARKMTLQGKSAGQNVSRRHQLYIVTLHSQLEETSSSGTSMPDPEPLKMSMFNPGLPEPEPDVADIGKKG